MPLFHRLVAFIFVAFFAMSLCHAAPIERNYPQPDTPPFWKSTVEDLYSTVHAVKKGTAKAIAISPGGRPVYLVAYGKEVELQSQANYNSAAAARNPDYYAKKTESTPPIVYIVGPPHGQEMEGVVGLLNLLHLAETGKDFRGRAWPRLMHAFAQCRVLIIPLANPDGRARCPYDSFVGIPQKEMTRVGQGTRKDGALYGWPGAKQLHPMQGNVGVLGAYFNDAGINPMHDKFFDPMTQETKAVLDVARENAPDYIINLHSHGQPAAMIATEYVPWYCKEIESRFADRLMKHYAKKDLPGGRVPTPSKDGESYPPPSFNLTSALHHVCGAVSMLFECPHGLKEDKYPNVNHEQILDIQLILYEELLNFAVENPRPGRNIDD